MSTLAERFEASRQAQEQEGPSLAQRFEAAQDEKRLREEHSQRAPGDSALDLTISLAQPFIDAPNNLINAGAEALGFGQVLQRPSDMARDAVRNTEVGFKAEEIIRRAAAEIASAPAAPAILYGLGGAVLDYALSNQDDLEFADVMLNDKARELQARIREDDDVSAKIELQTVDAAGTTCIPARRHRLWCRGSLLTDKLMSVSHRGLTDRCHWTRKSVASSPLRSLVCQRLQ